jgi:acylphosphatase
MADSTIRRRLIVYGQVQGVFFRDSTRREAEAARVAGSASNRADGAVEVVLEGPPDAVERVIAFCRQGPDTAWVEDVEVTSETPQGLESFDTR